MTDLELVAYYSAGYTFLAEHRAQQLAAGPTEPWKQATRLLNYIDLEITHLIAAMLLDGEGCAEAPESVNVARVQ